MKKPFETETRSMAGVGLLILTALVVFSGCAAILPQEKPTAELDLLTRKALMMSGQDTDRRQDGSLWEDRAPLNDLFANPKARRVGDVVTVRIIETAKASNKASTESERKSELKAGVTNFLGMENRYTPTSTFNPFGSIAGGLESNFDGNAGTERSGTMTAQLSATIIEVFPNGSMMIYGSREVMVNNERQLLTISGVIRQRDVSSENMVLSTYISDARIEYTGAGVVNDRQRPGWGSRILDVVWPF